MELTSSIESHLAQRGVLLTGVYHCPHFVDGIVKGLSIRCECRKPAPGMLLQAMRDHDIDMAQSVLVGDKISDIQAARAAGVGRSYLVAGNMDLTNHAETANPVIKSLAECADQLELAY